MDGINGLKKDFQQSLENDNLSGDQVASHIRRHVRSDRFHNESIELQKDLKRRLAMYAGLPQECLNLCSAFNRAVEWLSRNFCRPGDEALICGPEDNGSALLLTKFGVTVKRHYGPSPFSADLDGILEKISDKTKFIYLEQPGMVTGMMYSRFEIETILNAAGNAVLFLNESFPEYVGASMAELVRKYENLVIFRSINIPQKKDETPVAYILSGRETAATLSKNAGREHLPFIRVAAASAALSDLGKAGDSRERIHEAMIYLSVRLRGMGITCRLTPGNLVLIRAVDPERVVEKLNDAGIPARSLHHLHQMDHFLSMTVIDDSSARRSIETLETIPRQFITRKPVGLSKLTIRRHSENNTERDETKENNCTVKYPC